MSFPFFMLVGFADILRQSVIDKLPTITFLSFFEQNEQKLDFTISFNVIFIHNNPQVEKFAAKKDFNLFSPREIFRA